MANNGKIIKASCEEQRNLRGVVGCKESIGIPCYLSNVLTCVWKRFIVRKIKIWTIRSTQDATWQDAVYAPAATMTVVT